MVVSEDGMLRRLNSASNLANRLKSGGLSVFTRRYEDRRDNSVRNDSIRDDSIRDDFTRDDSSRSDSIRDDSIRDDSIKDDSNQLTQPVTDDLLNNVESRIKLSLIHSEALDVLNESVQMVKSKLDDIKPERLPMVIQSVSKVVESIRRERIEAGKSHDREVHYHFYTPSQKKLSDYSIIEVGVGET